MILAIDPGSEKSAWVLMDSETLKPLEFGIDENEEVLQIIAYSTYEHLPIEMVASYGMAVGKTVFETVFWIGRFWQVATVPPEKIYRKDVKMNLCQSMKAKDSNIVTALVDRFAKHDRVRGKGTKANPDWFYGFKADVWQSYAVGVTCHDMERVKAK